MYLFVVSLIIVTIISFLATTLYWFPFENMFINFSSPEDVFKYTTNGYIDKIIYGDSSCMIIYTDNNSKHTLFVLEVNNAYKIVTYPQYSKEHLFSKNYCTANIYTLNQTGDTYCVGEFISDVNDVNITDNFNTEYYFFKADESIYYFYGYINDYNENYSVYINSQETVFA